MPFSAECEYSLNPKFCLMLSHQPHNPELVKCTLSYRNDHIITVLHKCFFSGGRGSFAMHFDRLFTSTSQNVISLICHQVSIPMVSLVATAVS